MNLVSKQAIKLFYLPIESRSEANKATALQCVRSVIPRAIERVDSFKTDRQQLAANGGSSVPPSEGICLYNTLD